jgi:hypothetical protein
MSEMGHSRRFGRVSGMSVLASIADTPDAAAIFAFGQFAEVAARPNLRTRRKQRSPASNDPVIRLSVLYFGGVEPSNGATSVF